MVSQALGVPAYQTYGNRQRKAAAPVAASSDGSNQGRSRVPSPRVNYRAPQLTTNAAPVSKNDSAEFSPQALGRTKAASKSASNDPAADSVQQSPDILGSIVEQYTRERAVYSYSTPLQGGGSFNVTFEVESAYRVTQVYGPGALIDAQA